VVAVPGDVSPTPLKKIKKYETASIVACMKEARNEQTNLIGNVEMGDLNADVLLLLLPKMDLIEI
jgi:hypothetical protein